MAVMALLVWGARWPYDTPAEEEPLVDKVAEPSPRLTRDGCQLCRAERITPWYHEDEVCWIAECEICAVPMVVWRWHGTAPPAGEVEHMRRVLHEVAARQLGAFWVDDHMRNIPDHWHAHARPRGGFFGARRGSSGQP